jgi:hypothetical protein
MEERKLITARNAGGVLGNIDTSGRGCNTKWPIHPLLHQLWQTAIPLNAVRSPHKLAI